MVRVDEDAEIPEAGAVFTFGKSRFADNVPSKFWFRNDVVTRLDSGDEHTLVVTANGRVYAFGNNDWGQLGLGTTRNVSKPTCIKALKQEKVKCVGAGRSHSVVYTESGRIYTFGGNGEGQLGLGHTSDRHEPSLLESFSYEVKSVAAGSYHSAVLTVDGKLFTFGCNNQGQLGLGEGVEKVFVPTQVQIDAPVTYISCGYYHTAFVANGKLYTCGEKEGGKLGLLEKQLSRGTALPQCIFSIAERVASVSAGGNHTALVTECGKLYMFGSGLNGQLGLGTMVMETGAPSLVGAFDAQTVFDVSCGESHTAIIIGQGRLLTCGDGRHGKLGLGNDNFSNQFSPVPLNNFRQYYVHQVSCGGCHMVVLATKRAADDPLLLAADDVGETLQSSSPTAAEAGAAGGDGMLLTARGRRREKEGQGKTLMPVGRSLPPLLNMDNAKMDNANDDSDRLQRDLAEMDAQQSENRDHKDEVVGKALSSEVPQLNETHELQMVDGAQSEAKLAPIRSFGANDEPIKKPEKIVVARKISSGSSTDESESEKETAEEKKKKDDGNDDANEEETKDSSNTTINNHGDQEEQDEAPKKESFLKKIFSFKRKKSASKPKKSETVTTSTPEPKTVVVPAAIIPQSAPTTQETETAQSQDVQAKSEEVGSGEKDGRTSEGSGLDTNKTTNEQTSKTCNIL